MELILKEPDEKTFAQRYLAKRLDRRFRDRKPPFTPDALDKWLAEVLAPVDVSDLLAVERTTGQTG
jgi:hypothetical protein